MDLDDALDAAAAEAASVDAALEVVGDDTPETMALIAANGAVASFGTMLATLQSLPQLTLDTAGQRTQAVALYNALEPIEAAADMHRRAIAGAFRRKAQEEGADRILVGDGRTVGYQAPQAGYRIDEQGLRRGLERLVKDGRLTQEQVDEAMHVEITYVPNHTKLNALARHFGAAVSDVIEANREKVPGKGPGRVIIPKQDGGR